MYDHRPTSKKIFQESKRDGFVLVSCPKPVLSTTFQTTIFPYSIIRLAAALAALGLSTSCAHHPVVLSSKHMDNTVGVGVIYSLPRQLVQVKFAREIVAYEKLLDAYYKQKTAVDLAAKALADEKSSVTNLTAQLTAFKGDDEGRKSLQEEVDRANARVAVANETHKSATVELSKIRQALQDPTSGTGTTFVKDVFTVQLQPISPDPKLRLVARLPYSKLRHDKLEITTTPAGLLEGGMGTSESKVADVVLEGIGFLGAALKAGDVMKLTASHTASTPSPPLPFTKQWIVDPSNPEDLTKIKNELKSHNAYYSLKLTPGTVATSSCVITDLKHEKSGLYYRRPIAQTLIISDANDNFVDSFQLVIPNGGPIGRVEFPSVSWVKTDYQFTFKDGMLVSYKADMPSQALAAASMPARALKAIIAIPTELIQLKIDLSSKDKDLLAAQKAYIDSQIVLLEAERMLQEARDKQVDVKVIEAP